MKSLIWGLVVGALACFPMTVQADWNAAGDFSSTSNPAGAWSYGSRASLNDTSLAVYTTFSTSLPFFTQSGPLSVWNGPDPSIFGTPFVLKNESGSDVTIESSPPAVVPAGRMMVHPGPSLANEGIDAFTVVRWTAPAAGTFNVSATFYGMDIGSTDVHVVLNGTSIFDAVRSDVGDNRSYNGSVTVAAGDTIDFVVGNDSDSSFDSTGLDASIAAPNASFAFADFSNVSCLTLNGSAAQAGAILRLTPSLEGQNGSAWYTCVKSHIAAGFDTTFTYQMWGSPDFPDGADGLAFVIQDEGTSALGSTGSDMGFGGITRSLAVEFDTFGIPPETDNHISVQTRGIASNSPDDLFSLGLANPATDLNDGNPHTIRIRYVPGTLNVFLDDLATPALTVAVDLQNIFGDNILDGSGNAWVGFTASTGLLMQNQDILDWSFSEGRSSIVYSNLAVDPFATGHAWVIAGSDWGYNGWASKFSSSGDYSVFQIDVAVSEGSGTPTMVVGLYTNSSGLPGTLISGPYTVAIPACCTLTSITLDTPVAIYNGQTYWVGILPGAADTNASWHQNPDLGENVAFSPDGTTWFDSGYGNAAYPGEFDVLGTPGSGPTGECDCQHAISIGGNAFFSDSTTGALPCNGPSCAVDASPAKIYAFTPTEGGLGAVNTCNFVNFDSVISVYSGCPFTAENELACDHDACGLGAQVQFCAQQGHTYYIRVGGVAGASGDYDLLANVVGATVWEGPFQNPANGHWYYWTYFGPWTAAEQVAMSKGGKLATINNAAENEWVRSTFANLSGQVAIGINDAASEGSFVWTSGEPVTYTNWQTGQPDNNGNEDYGVMIANGEWLDQIDCAGGNGGGVIEVATVPLPGIVAGPIRNPANCHDYYFTQPGTWIETQLKAQALGGNLVTINNTAENEWVRTTFANFGGNPQAVWIGLTDRDVEGTFVWADGSAVSYTNWNAGEPNNMGNEDYVTMNDPATGGWNDWRSGGPLSGVIEITARHCPCLCPLGDMNCDDAVNTADIPFFVQALLQSGGFGGCDINLADMNGDTLINGLDAQAFVTALLNG